jgi:hypothetical protein
MTKRILALFTMLASLHASANETWAGYKPIEKVSAPYKAVAMASVIKIYSVTLKDNESNNYEIVDTESTKKITNRKKLATDLRTLQIETCRNQGLKRCPVFKNTFNGTGFINNGASIYTCRHMVHNWVTVAAKENGLTVDQISPAVRFEDYSGKIIYNSATSEDLIAISAINPDTRLNFVLKHEQGFTGTPLDILYMQSEFLEFKSPTDLIKSQSLSIVKNIQKNTEVYFTGYPLKTTMFGGKSGDTPGNIMVSSTGLIANTSADFQLFIADAVVTGGMSGGMATTESGEVLGIACSSNNDGTDPNEIRSSAVILNREDQFNLWNRLASKPL